MDISELIALTINRNQVYFEEYLKEHKSEILAELSKSGKCVIKSPYGLTATITAEKKES